MHEIELKFQVATAQRDALARAIGTASARRTRLQAVYFDTPDRALARAGIALRLRKEGPRWVQTLKAGAPHDMLRLEHEVALAARGATPPPLDPGRHVGHPAGARLQAVIEAAGGAVAAPLVERYRTDISRLHRIQRVPGGLVELAFDTGRILGGGGVLPVCELEIECVRGEPAVVIEAARRWLARFGLWLDVRSKAERGDALARGVEIPPAAHALPVALDRRGTLHAARRAAVEAALAQVLPNASAIAAGRHDGSHVHQMRVGLRRLRSLLRFLASPAIDDGEIDRAIGELFRALGAARDRDAISLALDPQLEAAGAPRIGIPAGADESTDGADVGMRIRQPATTQLFLDLLSIVHAPVTPVAQQPAEAAPPVDDAVAGHTGASDDAPTRIVASPAAPPADPPALHERLQRRLLRWHRRLAIDPQAFLALDDPARHALRKQAKRLRYAAEFARPLYRRQPMQRYLKGLRRLQARLGQFNDLCVAETAYRQLAMTDPRAWFAVGWIISARGPVLAACAEAFAALGSARDLKAARRRR